MKYPTPKPLPTTTWSPADLPRLQPGRTDGKARAHAGKANKTDFQEMNGESFPSAELSLISQRNTNSLTGMRMLNQSLNIFIIPLVFMLNLLFSFLITSLFPIKGNVFC